MAKYKNVTTDFSGGLVTDHILGRVDIERLQKSAKPFTNFFPSLQGPAQEYITEGTSKFLMARRMYGKV